MSAPLNEFQQFQQDLRMYGEQAALDMAALRQRVEIHAKLSQIHFPKTEQSCQPSPGCRQSEVAPEGPGSAVNKPLMRKPRGAYDCAHADRDTAGTLSVSREGESPESSRGGLAHIGQHVNPDLRPRVGPSTIHGADVNLGLSVPAQAESINRKPSTEAVVEVDEAQKQTTKPCAGVMTSAADKPLTKNLKSIEQYL